MRFTRQTPLVKEALPIAVNKSTEEGNFQRKGFGVGNLSREVPYEHIEPLSGPRILERKKKTKFRKDSDTTPLRESKQGTALHWAVDPWKEEEARSILEKRVIDINAKDNAGQTALHVLATQNKPEAVQLLLDYGADVNAVDDNGVTPLHCAVYHRGKTVVSVLLDAGADINAQDVDMKPPLYAAIRRNSLAAAAILLDAGAQVDPQENQETSVIHFATRLKRKRILEMVLNQANPNSVNFREPGDVTPLHIAAEQGQYLAVHILLRGGADINAKDANGNTPLHLAVQELKQSAVAVLCRLGANVHLENNLGAIPDEVFVKKHEHKTSKSIPHLADWIK